MKYFPSFLLSSKVETLSHKDRINCTTTNHTHKNHGVLLRRTACPMSPSSRRPRRCEAPSQHPFHFLPTAKQKIIPTRAGRSQIPAHPAAGRRWLRDEQVLHLHILPSSTYCPHFLPKKINWGLNYSVTEKQRVKAGTM